jgi:hypothetical protein
MENDVRYLPCFKHNFEIYAYQTARREGSAELGDWENIPDIMVISSKIFYMSPG